MIFISDLHLGDGSGADDFHSHFSLRRLLDECRYTGERIVICGDLLELWQCELRDIEKAHGKLLDELFSRDGIVVVVPPDLRDAPFDRDAPRPPWGAL